MKIPFTRGQELEEKLSSFYPRSLQSALHQPINITSHITLKENNFLFLSRNNLIYQLDLRSLAGVVAQQNSSDTTQISLFNIDFTIKCVAIKKIGLQLTVYLT